MSDSVRPHRQQPTRLPRPWDSPGKNTGVGCHFLLQCMKVKSESEVTQSWLTLSDPMNCGLLCSSIHGIFQARVLEWVAISFSRGSSWPRDWTQVSHLAGRSFIVWASREALGDVPFLISLLIKMRSRKLTCLSTLIRDANTYSKQVGTPLGLQRESPKPEPLSDVPLLGGGNVSWVLPDWLYFQEKQKIWFLCKFLWFKENTGFLK